MRRTDEYGAKHVTPLIIERGYVFFIKNQSISANMPNCSGV